MGSSHVPDVRSYLEIRSASPSGFSPTGEHLLVSSNRPGTSQLFRMPSHGGELLQLTDFEEPVGGGYLPHERRLLLAMDAGGNERHQLYLTGDDHDAPVTDPQDLEPLVVDPDHIHRPGGVSRDGRWLAYATNRRNGTDFDVIVRDLGSGDETPVYEVGGWNGAAGFSPNGRYLAISSLTEKPGDNELRLLDRETGELVEIAPHDGEATVGAPSWLPDGSAFFFATDVGRETVAIARYDVDRGSWNYVIEGDWDTGCGIDWTGRHLLVARNVDGISEAELRDPYTLTVTRRVPLDELPGVGVAGGYRFSRDGSQLAFSYSSSAVPGDVWHLDTDTGELERLTSSPCDVDPATFVDPELVRFPSFDGLEVPAFVFRPTTPPEGRRPVVVVVHGGPESQYRPSFSPLVQYLVARGFAVVAPNVRGSTGYGKTYEHLDDVEKRLDSVADLGALHDWIAGTDDLDPDRCALYGGSYGGYMVLAGLAFQPDRWAAGVDVVGISSLVTFLENTSSWRRKFREREYGSLEHDRDFLEEASPITHVDEMRAPLFIIHGKNDPRVPLSEAEQLHDVLERNGIRSELLVYDDEGHGLAKLTNRVDAYPKVAAFLEDVLAG
ncbi:MAG: S9 family peptidase [Nitriliruptorales bacterium]|nr:S9 family peptidase [Nitriliruptorales bacterium]